MPVGSKLKEDPKTYVSLPLGKLVLKTDCHQSEQGVAFEADK